MRSSLTPKILAAILLLILLWFARGLWDYFDPNSPANLSMQVQLKLFGTALYEYHSQTNRWPDKVDDLAQTSLPARSYVWRQTADAIVFLWPQNLNARPELNGNILLAYWKGGLFNRFGKVWACWGDLRTERLPETKLPSR